MNTELGHDDPLVILGDLTASLRSMHERLEILRARIATLEEQARQHDATAPTAPGETAQLVGPGRAYVTSGGTSV